MTASQMKRIRAKLARAQQLAAEAHELARAGHGDYSLRELTAHAADAMTDALRALQMWDDRMAQHAAAIARDLTTTTGDNDR